jgi:hypothetical protein
MIAVEGNTCSSHCHEYGIFLLLLFCEEGDELLLLLLLACERGLGGFFFFLPSFPFAHHLNGLERANKTEKKEKPKRGRKRRKRRKENQWLSITKKKKKLKASMMREKWTLCANQ